MTTNELNEMTYVLLALRKELNKFISSKCIGYHQVEVSSNAVGCESCLFYNAYEGCCDNSVTHMGTTKFLPADYEVYNNLEEGLKRTRKLYEEKLAKDGLAPQLIRAMVWVDCL